MQAQMPDNSGAVDVSHYRRAADYRKEPVQCEAEGCITRLSWTRYRELTSRGRTPIAYTCYRHDGQARKQTTIRDGG